MFLQSWPRCRGFSVNLGSLIECQYGYFFPIPLKTKLSRHFPGMKADYPSIQTFAGAAKDWYLCINIHIGQDFECLSQICLCLFGTRNIVIFALFHSPDSQFPEAYIELHIFLSWSTILNNRFDT